MAEWPISAMRERQEMASKIHHLEQEVAALKREFTELQKQIDFVTRTLYTVDVFVDADGRETVNARVRRTIEAELVK